MKSSRHCNPIQTRKKPTPFVISVGKKRVFGLVTKERSMLPMSAQCSRCYRRKSHASWSLLILPLEESALDAGLS